MTRLPADDRNVIDRPDLPEYELNTYCAVKDCTETREYGGGHHAWRRSFGTRSWWVELSDGTVVGNRIGLCPGHHHAVTVNKSRLVWENGHFYFQEGDRDPSLLRWQPTVHGPDGGGGPAGWLGEVPAEVKELPQLAHLEPGHDCPTCKRRVPIPKKKTSPTDTKPMTFGRAPADAADELKDRVNDLAVSSGLSTAPYPQVRAIMLALLLAESVHPDLLQEVASDMTWGKKKDG